MRGWLVLGLVCLSLFAFSTPVTAQADYRANSLAGPIIPNAQPQPDHSFSSSSTEHDDCAPVANGSQREHPDTDVLGWENGCWHNDPINIDQTDGLSEAERKAIVSRSMARIEEIRDLEFLRDVSIRIMQRSTLQELVGNREPSEQLRIFDNVKFEALFLINESIDSIAVQSENRGASILGFYRSQTSELVLIAPSESETTVDERVLAHELTHALQDQHFNLSDPRFYGQTRDEINAIDGVVEGDANYVEHLYYSRRCENPSHPWNGTCVRPPDTNQNAGPLANLGVYFVKFQPYSDGPNLIRFIKQRDGWAGVNDLYSSLPVSAEQVMVPEKYGRDQPRDITLTDQTTADWTRVRPPGRPDHAVLGQSGIASMLVFPLYDSGGETQIVSFNEWLNLTLSGRVSSFDPLNYNFEAASGWDGDRLHVYENNRGEHAYVWRIGWDSVTDAQLFRETYDQVLRYWGGEQVSQNRYRISEGQGFADAFAVIRQEDTVLIVNAPTVAQLSSVRTSLTQETDSGNSTRTPLPTLSPTATNPSTQPPTNGFQGDGESSETALTEPTTQTQTAVSQTAPPTAPTTPGFGVLVGVTAMLSFLILGWRRRR